MDETERTKLAQRLSAMTFKQARREILQLDRQANLKFWRNSIWDEYHSLFLLPNQGLSIILVEKGDVESTDKRDHTGPPDRKQATIDYKYVEARVEPLERPVAKF